MRKNTETWTIRDLRDRFNLIHFPEYQREPTVWGRDAKQRLIDSITRRFDIASFYFYVNADESWDCVDGRQRIGAIMSFLGLNDEDREHKGFEYRVLNEIFEDPSNPDRRFDGRRWSELEGSDDPADMEFMNRILDYELTVIMLRDSAAAEEFNLQFTRLNLGTIINSGEKLNAMVGELRDACFRQLATHAFLQTAAIPTRRFAREQLAAQIVAQVFAIADGGPGDAREYARIRHHDLQRLFKEHTTLGEDRKALLRGVRATMDLLASDEVSFPALRSRAMVLSAFLLAHESGIVDEGKGRAQQLAEFLSDYSRCLKWQIPKGLDVDPEYRWLVNFQRHLTQASVEKPAVRYRANALKDAYEEWLSTGELPGDADYRTSHPGENPAELRRAMSA